MPRQERRALGVTVCLFALAYALTGLFRHWHFGSNAFDLGIFDQAIWHYSRFEAPISSLRGGIHILGDHFHPILILLAPLYWIAPGPEALIVAQSVLLAASIVPVYTFVRRRLSMAHTLTLCVVYGSFWGIQRAAWFDFHELAFAPLLIGLAVNAIDTRRWRLLAIACAGLMLVKEDMIPVVCGFGAYIFLFVDRRRGAALAVIALIVFVAVMSYVIPGLNNGGWAYGGAFEHIIERPWTAPLALVSPPAKLLTALVWLAPFVFLPLWSRWTLLAVPLVLERLLSTSPSHWGYGSHYSAPLAPILAMAAGDALARLQAALPSVVLRRRTSAALLTLAVIMSMTVPGHQPLLRLFAAKHYRARPDAAAAREALALIPAGASVVAQSSIVPHLSSRDRVYLLDADAPDAEFVIAASSLTPWPLEHADAVAELVHRRRAAGYREIFSKDGWIVLRQGHLAR